MYVCMFPTPLWDAADMLLRTGGPEGPEGEGLVEVEPVAVLLLERHLTKTKCRWLWLCVGAWVWLVCVLGGEGGLAAPVAVPSN